MKSQIDYIVIQRKGKNYKECYKTFASVGSDHRILTARIKLSLRTSNMPPIQSWYHQIFRKRASSVSDENKEVLDIFDALDIKEDNFAMNEYQAVEKRLKEKKAADPDGITTEVLKRR